MKRKSPIHTNAEYKTFVLNIGEYSFKFSSSYSLQVYMFSFIITSVD